MRTPKISFKAIKRRLLELEVWFYASEDGQVFSYRQEKVLITVRWRQKINVTELQNYMAEKLRTGKFKNYKSISIDSVVSKNVGPVWEVNGDV